MPDISFLLFLPSLLSHPKLFVTSVVSTALLELAWEIHKHLHVQKGDKGAVGPYTKPSMTS